MSELDFSIARLGEATIESPVKLSTRHGDWISDYVGDGECIYYDIETGPECRRPSLPLEKAGPRERIYFNPADVHAAIVTCGGLCPGLNDVIRAMVMTLWYQYGVRRISGMRYGYRGFLPEFNYPVMSLTPDGVADIHRRGGTILGSSRGYGDERRRIVDTIEKLGINMLFTIGGDGTQRGSLVISREIADRGLEVATVGVPKTIDNDLSFVDRSFGFDTAVSTAVDAIYSAHIEALDAPAGIGIVKVMGRQSGFIAAHAALALSDVNYVLVPEVPFDLDGGNGLLSHLEKRLDRRDHAVILVAEGAGQDLMGKTTESDASGNIKLGDIGLFLKKKIADYFNARGREVNIKYIDPSYIIRAVPANPNDSIFCGRLGTAAAHAAMSGRTEMLVSLLHNEYVHVPISMAVSRQNTIDPDGGLWRSVVETTGQPRILFNEPRA